MCVIPDTDVTREAIVAGKRETSCSDHAWVRARQLRECESFVIECFISDHHNMIGVAFPIDNNTNMDDWGMECRYVINNKLVYQEICDYDWSLLLDIECTYIVNIQRVTWH
ncbi:unnamed protein product [Chrysodeixis includens]|uniref:Uncharacterized protein n=1 Tax=Chrysodeixis includens TaxID=689277 RepID=A0A9N8KX23_CHRIL|nr:unnamed protein product [Chrysodeixis includens]